MIRVANENDLNDIKNISIESFNNTNVKDLKFMMESPNYMFLVFFEKRVLGYLILMVVGDDVDVISLAVNKEHRREGVGEKLLCYSIEKMKNMQKESLILEVRESNFKAISLYKKVGFSEIFRREKYYDYTEDAIIFKRSLR